MMKPNSLLNTEDGYFLILATLMILVLLTILGVAASRTANTEMAIAANEVVYQQNFYRAEGAAIQAVDILANTSDLRNNPPAWFEMSPGSLTDDNVKSAYWDVAEQALTLDDTGNTRYVAGLEFIQPGSSLDMDRPQAWSIAVYGRCERNGLTTIRIGYVTAF
jgi:hypothetical protein